MIAVCFVCFVCFFPLEAQVEAQENAVSIDGLSDNIKAVVIEGGNTVRIVKKNGEPFTPEESEILKATTYRIYRVSLGEDGLPKLDQVSDNPIERVNCGETACRTIVISLKNALPVNGSYLILPPPTAGNINPLPISFSPPIKPVETTAKILPATDGARDKLRILSSAQVTATQSQLKIINERLVLSNNGANTVKETAPDNPPLRAQILDNDLKPVASVQSNAGSIIRLELDKKLPGGRNNSLSVVSGLTDAGGNTIIAGGKITTPGLPKKADEIGFEFRLATQTAEGQKPAFDLYTKASPLSRRLPDGLFGSGFYFEPDFTIDLGLGTTKSSNSIIVNLPIRKKVRFGSSGGSFNAGKRPSLIGGTNSSSSAKPQNTGFADLDNYARWRRISPFDWLGDAYFYLGPKLEADRRFARINTLGTLKVEFRLDRWRGSIRQQRDYLIADASAPGIDEKEANRQRLITEDQAKQIRLRYGFSLTPFIGLDFGGKSTIEVIQSKNKAVRAIIPRHTILRGFAGFNNVIEWEMFALPVSVTTEANLFYMAKRETIGFALDKSVDFRKVEGFQHLGKLSFDFYFNHLRRYSFNITYENGRKAPNFEYLNKATAGFRLIY